uniref:Uncharacterized protein n=1 Tax=Helianthus annuus TaxID=4232 RepID=A0A251VJ90_HELAN
MDHGSMYATRQVLGVWVHGDLVYVPVSFEEAILFSKQYLDPNNKRNIRGN